MICSSPHKEKLYNALYCHELVVQAQAQAFLYQTTLINWHHKEQEVHCSESEIGEKRWGRHAFRHWSVQMRAKSERGCQSRSTRNKCLVLPAAHLANYINIIIKLSNNLSIIFSLHVQVIPEGQESTNRAKLTQTPSKLVSFMQKPQHHNKRFLLPKQKIFNK